MDRTIPKTHLDLVDCPPVAALTTLMPDGYPQTSVVCRVHARRVTVDAIHAS